MVERQESEMEEGGKTNLGRVGGLVSLVSDGVLAGGKSGADGGVGVLQQAERWKMVRDRTGGRAEKRKTNLGDVLVGLLGSTGGELLSGLGDVVDSVLDGVGGGLENDREGWKQRWSDEDG